MRQAVTLLEKIMVKNHKFFSMEGKNEKNNIGKNVLHDIMNHCNQSNKLHIV